MRRAHRVAGQYIVVLHDVSDDELDRRIDDLAQAHGATVEYRYRYAFQGFLARMSEWDAAAMSRQSIVDFVQEDSMVTVNDGIAEAQAPPSPTRLAPVIDAVQFQPPWHLDRIDQRNLPLDQMYNYLNVGTGVHIYIVDSGIHYSHVEFGGRVATNTLPGTGGSVNFAPNDPINRGSTVVNPSYIDDCLGHGTRVASQAAGSTLGVAKNATLHSVRISNCWGDTLPSKIAQGIDWIIQNKRTPAVVNISYNYVVSTLPLNERDVLETAIRNLLLPAHKITTVVSAGNFGTDASANTPGRMTDVGVLVVGASDANDARWIGPPQASCFGASVDLYAPGASVSGAVHTSTTGTVLASGTSYGAPLVAGYAALLLQSSPWLTPAQVEGVLLWWATANKITNVPSGNPSLLYAAQ